MGSGILTYLQNFVNILIVSLPIVWNLVADIEGGEEAEGVWEYGIEENIWT